MADEREIAVDPDVLEDDEEMMYLSDDEGNETAFRVLSRLRVNDGDYIVLEDAEDEESVMIFGICANEDGEEEIAPLDDEDEVQEVFYYFQAEFEDYEFCDAE